MAHHLRAGEHRTSERGEHIVDIQLRGLTVLVRGANVGSTILSVMRETKAYLLHIGSVTAAVIGRHQLIYDVFGSTVNAASRVMSCWRGATDGDAAVACSEDLQQLLDSTAGPLLRFSPPVSVQMKGLGTCRLYGIMWNSTVAVTSVD